MRQFQNANAIGKRTGNSPVLMFVNLAVFLSGCTGSIHPLLSDKDLPKNSDLSGEWILEVPDQDKNVRKIPIELEGYDTSTYDFLVSAEWLKEEGEKKTRGWKFPDAWTLQIGRIDDQVYGQIIPRDLPAGPPVAFGVPVYWFGKVSLGDSTIEFTPVCDDWATLANREELSHVRFGAENFVQMTIYTMPTTELQKVVRKYDSQLSRSSTLVLRKRSVNAER